jgi:hypothetical protein
MTSPPKQESVELLERMVHEYVGEMCRQVRIFRFVVLLTMCFE